MNRGFPMIVLVGLAACGNAPAKTAPPAQIDNALPPDVISEPSAADVYAATVKLDTITCPAGTILIGAPPPEDDYAYCELPDGTRHGPWMTWPTYGNQRKIAINDHDVTVHWTAWYQGDDTLETVSDDRRTLEWHDNGQLAFDGHYADDAPHGRCQAWDRDGAQIFDATFDDGTGQLIHWYDGLKVEEHWKNGALDGPRTQWFANGQVESIQVFVAGKSTDYERWYPSGVKAEEHRGGSSTSWDKDGREEPEMCAHGPCDMEPEGVNGPP
jgi:hypothetical protein